MGWERREATLEQEGGNGLGVLRKGVRAGGSGPGRAGGAPPPFPTYRGKELPARELVRGVGADVAPTRDAGTGNSTSPLPLAHLHPCRAGAGGQVPRPLLRAAAGGAGGNAAPWPCPAGTWGHEYLEIGAAVLREVGEPWEGLRHGQRAGGCLVACSSCVQYTHARTNTSFCLYMCIYLKLQHSPCPSSSSHSWDQLLLFSLLNLLLLLFSWGLAKG